MPHETTLYDDGIYWRYSGSVPFKECREAKTEVWGLPQWDDFNFKVVDVLNAGPPEMSEPEARGSAFMDKPAAMYTHKMKVAIAANDPGWVSLGQAYVDTLDTAGWEAAIFDNLDDAFTWARAS